MGARNLTQEIFYTDCCWTAPAGVKSVRVRTIPNCHSAFEAGCAKGGAIDSNCDLYMWGSNAGGGLGINSITPACQPTKVCCGFKWRTFAVGSNFDSSGGITTAGDLYMWGSGSCGVQGNNTITSNCQPTLVCCGFKWKMLAIGGTLAVGITCSGDMYAWGSGTCGGLGNNTITSVCQPVLVCCGFKWKFVSVAFNSVLAITVNGDAYGWGDASCGRLGTANCNGLCQPTLVACCHKWKFIHLAGTHGGGINCFGDLYTWGANNGAQLANGTSVGLTVGTPRVVCCSQVAGFKWKWFRGNSSCASLAITVGGDIYVWGTAYCGMFGTNNNTFTSCPVQICCGFKWRQAGMNQVVAGGVAGGVTKEGCLFMWGDGTCGAAGNNTITTTCQPTLTCCQASPWGTFYQQNARVFDVAPGGVYLVSLLGRFATFQGDVITDDYFTDAVALEYFS